MNTNTLVNSNATVWRASNMQDRGCDVNAKWPDSPVRLALGVTQTVIPITDTHSASPPAQKKYYPAQALSFGSLLTVHKCCEELEYK